MRQTLTNIVMLLLVTVLAVLNAHQGFVIDGQRAEIEILSHRCQVGELTKDTGNDDWTIKQWYDFYNQRYFHSELPENTEIEYTNLYDQLGRPAMGVTDAYRNGRYKIRLDVKYNLAGSTARLTLLHEMAHIQVRLWPVEDFDMHGPLFQMVMHRLANQGAMEDLW